MYFSSPKHTSIPVSPFFSKLFLEEHVFHSFVLYSGEGFKGMSSLDTRLGSGSLW